MKNLIRVAAFLTLLAASVSLLFGFNQTDEQPTIDYPQKLTHRFLINAEDKEIEAHIEYYQDAATRTASAIKYKNGFTTVQYYHPEKQTLTRVLDYYFEDPDAKPRLLSESHFSEDGKRLTQHSIYRMDGTLERLGAIQTDGNYKVVFLAADGITVQLERVFEEDQVLHSEHAFHKDGTTKFKTEWTSSYLTTKFFNDDGTPIMVVQNHHSMQRGVFLREDGETTNAVFSKTSEEIELIYFDENDNVAYRLQVTPGRVLVGKVEQSKVLYQQSFKTEEDIEVSYCGSTNTLQEVTVFDVSKSYLYRSEVERKFRMSDDGSYPISMTVPSSSAPAITYQLDPTGTVTAIEIEGEKPSATPAQVKTEYKIGDKVTLDPNLFEIRQFECFQIPEKLEVPQIRIYRR